jgi:hypothetical protein
LSTFISRSGLWEGEAVTQCYLGSKAVEMYGVQQRKSIDTYGEWPDYVEDVISGEIWLVDPFCPGPEDMWVRGDSYTSKISDMTWWKYTKREV